MTLTLPSSQHVERLAYLVFAHQYGLRGLFLPVAHAQDLPYLDVGEILEQALFAQCGEFLGFIDFQIAFFEVAELGQFVAEVAPGGKALGAVLLHGDHHDTFQLRRQIGAQSGGRYGFFVHDLLVQVRQVLRAVRRMAGEQAIHDDAQ